MKRLVLLTALLSSVGVAACSDGFFGGEKDKPPLPGERISVLDAERSLRPDTDAPASFQQADQWQNDTWPQAGGYPSHAMQNLALASGGLKRLWSTDIGEGSRKNLPLTSQPVVVGKTIFALDTDAQLSAFSTDDGKKRWSTDVRDMEEEDPVISGGIAAEAGFIYVTAGYDEVLCVDAQKGEIKWRSAITGPSRAAPTIQGGRVYVTTMNNSILALNAADGKVLWEFSGLGASTGLVGAASPAATSDMVVPVFTSGEIYALRSGNGSVAWSDNLSNALRLGGLNTLSDIRGLPVIDDNMAYAISYGGKMAAIDMRTGARLWQKDISGSKTPWVSGSGIFVITGEGQIVSLDKTTGNVLWVSQLARYKDKEDRTGAIIWTGPIMAGNRLMAFGSHGRVAEIDASKGTLIREWEGGDSITISPVVAGGALYILEDDGSLTAYK